MVQYRINTCKLPPADLLPRNHRCRDHKEKVLISSTLTCFRNYSEDTQYAIPGKGINNLWLFFILRQKIVSTIISSQISDTEESDAVVVDLDGEKIELTIDIGMVFIVLILLPFYTL